ncbi:Clp protease N-terminal domain-containing protein [Prauserella cavernicola]|uniref:ATPase n=1 Tax=Prauserella cavernicola TaxID=2800127 RepID=A0A934V3E6_9PSEU|nr:Clp protease N-terminal domain-containing protein [Prauserella cavernicola]MBK1784257.1 ATPase [Prauserella cavernicola]
MFERFTKDTRAVVTEAVREATRLRSPEIDPLHLLVALTRFPRGGAAALLDALDVALDDVRAQVERARRRGGVSETDAQALEGLGIDVDAIVAHVESEHGPGALTGGWRRTGGHIPFGSAAKRVLERTLRETVGLGQRTIGGEHLLTALAVVPGPAADVLAGQGLTPDLLRTALRTAS